ncbi:MAG: DUF4340 domain-containing protein, partial [Gammaproteobacteria bacterium]|nr:DUF4340 domain-containing protein [Gammaproteobacteria bacterium]
MKKHHFGVLVVAVISAMFAAFWASTLHESVRDTDALLPGLEDAVNEVNSIRLIAGGNKPVATLTRGDTTWQLAEKAGYRANNSLVRELLLFLSRARLLEEKTSNPDYYSRLGVEAVDAADAAGIQVELEGVAVPAVIIGDQDHTRDGVYARRADEKTSWLVSGVLSLPDDTAQWFDQIAIDLNPARIAQVVITHADGETLEISKSTFGQPGFDVVNVPVGRELKRPNIADSIASVVNDMRVDDVLSLAEISFSELTVTRTSLGTFDGLVLDIVLAKDGERHLARLSATSSAEVAVRYMTIPAEASEDVASAEAATDSPAPLPDLSAVDAEAEKLNTRFSDWVY